MPEDSLTILEQNRDSREEWDLVEAKTGSMPGLYLPCFDMLAMEDAAWLVKVSDASPNVTRMEPHREEPEQCPVIDSQGQGLSPGMDGPEEERSLEQVQSMVVGEVLKDIETACKLLNITPGRAMSPPEVQPSLARAHPNSSTPFRSWDHCEIVSTGNELTPKHTLHSRDCSQKLPSLTCTFCGSSPPTEEQRQIPNMRGITSTLRTSPSLTDILT